MTKRDLLELFVRAFGLVLLVLAASSVIRPLWEGAGRVSPAQVLPRAVTGLSGLLFSLGGAWVARRLIR